MKRFSIFLLMICALSTNACAQWYLFPGKKKTVEERKDSVTLKPDPGRRPGGGMEVTDQGDTLHVDWFGGPEPEEVFELDVPSTIHIGLVLPLQASGKASDNFLDMYSGALLALRHLGNAGLKADLQVFDSADGKTPVPQTLIDECDVILGPVSYNDLRNTLPLCGRGKVLVSPLEPKAAELAGDGHLVQTPTPWTAQIDDLVRWVREELPIGDEVYVVRDTAAAGAGEQSAYLIRRLQEGSVRYRSVLSTREIGFHKDRKARVLIASDRESFITSAIRNLSIEGARNNDVILYGTTRIRTSGTGQADLHNTNAHVTAAYFIDYEDPAVKRFILEYRALFQNEPGSFSFQGYDTMNYFVSICAKYGRQWYKMLQEYSVKGLQSDFLFRKEAADARVNQAVRRIVYNSDLTVDRMSY